MIRRPPRSTQSRSSAASDVYKRQGTTFTRLLATAKRLEYLALIATPQAEVLSLIHISEPTRLGMISYAVFCLKKKKKKKKKKHNSKKTETKKKKKQKKNTRK